MNNDSNSVNNDSNHQENYATQKGYLDQNERIKDNFDYQENESHKSYQLDPGTMNVFGFNDDLNHLDDRQII